VRTQQKYLPTRCEAARGAGHPKSSLAYDEGTADDERTESRQRILRTIAIGISNRKRRVEEIASA
jgi:hypothetical protein